MKAGVSYNTDPRQCRGILHKPVPWNSFFFIQFSECRCNNPNGPSFHYHRSHVTTLRSTKSWGQDERSVQ